MTWHETDDVEQFLAAAGDLLFNEPGVHTISLTVCENVRARPDGTCFAYWQEPSGEVTGAASRTPPYPVVLAAMPDEAVLPLLELWPLDWVSGPTELAVQVAAVASSATGRSVRVHHAERLFRLETLQVPTASGAARVAEDDDLDLLVTWFSAFIDETGVPAMDVERSVRDRLSFGGMLLWEDCGEPVSLAGHTRKAFQGMRIGPVYTPPALRGRGYGGAVTAAASQRALDLGAWEVVLFTDLTNPTSNALYQRLGYRPVMDRAVIELSR